jgi:hypothetical protein
MRAKGNNRYRVFQREDRTEKIDEIGVVTWSDDHKLELASAARHRRDFLEKLLKRLNSADVIHVFLVPPPEAEHGAIYSRPVRRSDAGFREALMERLKMDYGIELKPN